MHRDDVAAVALVLAGLGVFVLLIVVLGLEALA